MKCAGGIQLVLCGVAVNIRQSLADLTEHLTVLRTDRLELRLEAVGGNRGNVLGEDDLLDVRSTTEELGKPVGSDEKNGKKTVLSYMTVTEAEAEARRLSEYSAHLFDSYDNSLVSVLQRCKDNPRGL